MAFTVGQVVFEDAQIVAVAAALSIRADERAVSIYGAFINPAAHDTRHKY
jgi:hypothetical protein